MIDLRLDPDTLEPVQAPLERLFRAYDGKVRRMLTRAYPRAGEDRIGDAMAHAWCQAARYPVSFHTADRWLFVVAKHELLLIFAREARQRATDDELLHDLAGGRDDTPIERLIAREEAERTLAGLIPNQRRALLARSLGLSYSQIAAAIGESYTHVNRHLTEGRARAWKERLAA